jgi:hypothetical protein
LKCELRNAGVDHVELEESWYTELKNERLQDEMKISQHKRGMVLRRAPAARGKWAEF